MSWLDTLEQLKEEVRFAINEAAASQDYIESLERENGRLACENEQLKELIYELTGKDINRVSVGDILEIRERLS